MDFNNITRKTKSFVIQCKRVWHVLKKPTKEEFRAVAKISAIAIAVLGVAGFFISLAVKPFF